MTPEEAVPYNLFASTLRRQFAHGASDLADALRKEFTGVFGGERILTNLEKRTGGKEGLTYVATIFDPRLEGETDSDVIIQYSPEVPALTVQLLDGMVMYSLTCIDGLKKMEFGELGKLLGLDEGPEVMDAMEKLVKSYEEAERKDAEESERLRRELDKRMRDWEK